LLDILSLIADLTPSIEATLFLQILGNIFGIEGNAGIKESKRKH